MKVGKPKALISITASFAVRNFFQTPIVRELSRHYRLSVYSPPHICKTIRSLGYDSLVELVEFDPGPEPLSWKLARQMKKKVYMEGRSSATEAIWEKYVARPIYQKATGKLIKAVVRGMGGGRLYTWLEKADMLLNKNSSLAAEWRLDPPAFFFATHATTYFEEFLYRNAMACGIPLTYMVLSWDHLSSKVLLHENLSKIMVWNRHTKEELLETYPSYRDSQIEIVGIPQYDPYVVKPTITYAEWCGRYGLDPGRKTILFSTMPQKRHEQQHIIAERLLGEIAAEGGRLGGYQMLIKCHPFDNFDGYGQLVGKYPVAIQPSSLPPGQDSESWVPNGDELLISRDCLYFCSININIFSTVTIEAAYFDKPVVHIGFDPFPIHNRIPCHEYYNWDHFKHIMDKGVSIMARSHDELVAAIVKYDENPRHLADGRRRVVETYIGDNMGMGAENVVRSLLSFSTPDGGGAA